MSTERGPDYSVTGCWWVQLIGVSDQCSLVDPEGYIKGVLNEDIAEMTAKLHNKKDELGPYALRTCPDCGYSVSFTGHGHYPECTNFGQFAVEWSVVDLTAA